MGFPHKDGGPAGLKLIEELSSNREAEDLHKNRKSGQGHQARRTAKVHTVNVRYAIRRKNGQTVCNGSTSGGSLLYESWRKPLSDFRSVRNKSFLP